MFTLFLNEQNFKRSHFNHILFQILKIGGISWDRCRIVLYLWEMRVSGVCFHTRSL